MAGFEFIKKITGLLKSKWIIALALPLVVLAVLKIAGEGFNQPETDGKYTLQPVRQGTIQIDFVADGQISLPIKNLDFAVRGKIKSIWVKPGQPVKKGQKLAELDTRDYEADLRKAEIDYEKARVNLLDAEQKTGLNLLTDANKLASALNGYGSLRAAKLNLEAAENSLEMARAKLAEGVLTAPADGKIVDISKEAGTVTGGSSADVNNTTEDSRVFISFLDSDKVYVKSSISESDINNIEMGQEVEVTVEAAEDEPVPGKVVALNGIPSIDNNGVVTYEVTVELADNPDMVREGMTSVISFIIRKKENVLVIPNKAIITDEGRQYVKVKGRDGKIIKKQVTTGLSDGEKVEVVLGLKRGENVMVREA